MFHQYVYYLGVPAGGVSSNNLTLTYDRRYQAWSQMNHIQPESFAIYIDTTNTEHMYFTSSNSSQIFTITPNTYSANCSAITSSWFSKSFDLGNFNVFKRWIDCTIFFRQLVGSVVITFYTDNGTISNTFSINTSTTAGIGSDLIGAFPPGGNTTSTPSNTSGSSANKPYRFHISTKSRTIQVGLSNANLNENFVVLGLAFRYRPYSAFAWPSDLKIFGATVISDTAPITTETDNDINI